MRIHGPNEPVYTIGVVARLLGISPQTLRLFEREGLIDPSRTESNIRLYSQQELVLLQRICGLIKQDGVNLAGVKTVLRVERRYERIIETLRIEAGLPTEVLKQVEQAASGPDESREKVHSTPRDEDAAGPGARAAGEQGNASPAPGTRSESKRGGGEWTGLGAMLLLLLCGWWY